MSDSDSFVENVVHTISQFSGSSPSHFMAPSRNVHGLFGGGHLADVFLWRKKHLSAGCIIGSTVVWLLFEWIGYHFVSVISFALLVAIVILFGWSFAADFLNRPPPPLHKLQLTDDQVIYLAKAFKEEVNRVLGVLHDISLGKDITRFLKLVAILSFLVLFGSWFHTLTLLFLAVVAVHTLPVLYEKHGDTIDGYANTAFKEFASQYKNFDKVVLSRIPRKQRSFQRKHD